MQYKNERNTKQAFGNYCMKCVTSDETKDCSTVKHTPTTNNMQLCDACEDRRGNIDTHQIGIINNFHKKQEENDWQAEETK